MSCDIKVNAGVTTYVEPKAGLVVKPTTIEVSEVNSLKVAMHPRSFTLCGNDVYVIKRNSSIPGWFEDQLNDMINNGDLATSVADLTQQFENFEDGVTMEIGYLREADYKLAYSLEVLKVSTDSNTAGIYNLDAVKVTENEARAISRQTVAAWQNDGTGGAWFDSQITVVSNVAYSAAKSASTLTAAIVAQSNEYDALQHEVDVLANQVDGKIMTWFSLENPVNPDGTINENIKPYSCWLPGVICSDPNYEDVSSADTRAEHTGDTYVYYEYDDLHPEQKNLIATFRFAYDTDTEKYEWYVFEDDLASEAYQRALAAQDTADGKVTSYYQSDPPNPIANPYLGCGDLWTDSDGTSTTPANTLYRYQTAGGVCDDIGPYSWVKIDNRNIQASVDRLDEATVNIEGLAKARGSLTVNADGSISGYNATATNDPKYPGSVFNIFADRFVLSANGPDPTDPYGKASYVGAPFSIDMSSTPAQIRFNGVVSFDNVDGIDGQFLTEDDFDGTKTIINGNAIYSNTIQTNRLMTNTAWINGWIKSSNYSWNGVENEANMPIGFGLFAQGTENGSYGYNIVGGKIYGGNIRGAIIEGGKLIGAEILLRNAAGMLAYTSFVDKVPTTTRVGENTYYGGRNFGIDFKLDETFPYDATENFGYARQNGPRPDIVFNGFKAKTYPAGTFSDVDWMEEYVCIQTWVGDNLVHTGPEIKTGVAYDDTNFTLQGAICDIDCTYYTGYSPWDGQYDNFLTLDAMRGHTGTAVISGHNNWGAITVRVRMRNKKYTNYDFANDLPPSTGSSTGQNHNVAAITINQTMNLD